jgi:hypothetical protein
VLVEVPNHIVDDRPEISFSEVRLSKRAARVAEVLNDNVDGDVIFGVQWGTVTQLHKHSTAAFGGLAAGKASFERYARSYARMGR